MYQPVSIAQPPIKKQRTQIITVTDFPATQTLIIDCLAQQDRLDETVKLNSCERGKLDSKGYCRSHFCLRCWHYKVGKQRKHLKRVLLAILKEHPRAELWHITACTADCHVEEIREHAKAAVDGTKRLLKCPELKNRVIASFSVLEVGQSHTRIHPFRCHTHTVLLCKQISNSRHRISQTKWLELWESCCSLHRVRVVPATPDKQRLSKAQQNNVSILAMRIPDLKRSETPEVQVRMVAQYVTKWGKASTIIRNFRKQLEYPLTFIQRTDQLRGVYRFWGLLTWRTSKSAEYAYPLTTTIPLSEE